MSTSVIPQKMRRSPNLMCLCIDENDEFKLKGRLYHYYNKSCLEFVDVMDAVREMDAVYDELDYPQSYTRARNFKHALTTEIRLGYDKNKKLRSFEELTENRGKLATIVVEVVSRANTTWQGEAVWVEAGKKASFESEVEFVKLMLGTLDN